MAVVLVATPGAANANSYLTVAEFQDYLLTNYEPTEHPDVPNDDMLLILATRLMETMFSPTRVLVVKDDPSKAYYIIRPTWTGTPASSIQALLWPRDGMYTRTSVLIANTVIPQELKNAVAELARQYKTGDKTIDSDAMVQGISSIRAGSVAISFKDYFNATKVIPDIVYSLLVPSWLTPETIEFANRAQFDVVS